MFIVNPTLLNLLRNDFRLLELPLTSSAMLLLGVVICADPSTAVLAVVIEANRGAIIQDSFQKVCPAV